MKIRAPYFTFRARLPAAAFTMVEIALSLAIIGFALVAIIGVLPIGMNVQRDNREQTIINQDATVFMDAIRSGARGLDDLTNYVMGITIVSNSFPITYLPATNFPLFTLPNALKNTLTNGDRIIGLLSTPQFELTPQGGVTSNYVVSYVRALSGLAGEKYPQNNATVLQDAFSYRMVTENVELPVPPAYSNNSPDPINRELTHNLRELRLLFRWPVLPSGKIGNGRQVFRTLVGGQLLRTNDTKLTLYFFQPQTYGKAP